MKHETTDHFEQSDIREVLQAARPDQILRLLRDISAARPDVREPQPGTRGNG